MSTITTVAEFIFELIRVVKKCKLDDYEAGDAIAFTEGYQTGASKEQGTNPYLQGSVRNVMWKQGECAAIVEGSVRYE